MNDPIDSLVESGLRVVWVPDMGLRVILVAGQGLVLADADLSREYVAYSAQALAAQ